MTKRLAALAFTAFMSAMAWHPQALAQTADDNWDGRFALWREPSVPVLAIFGTSTNTVAVSWPSPSTGWNLQQNTNGVSSAGWINVTSGIVSDGTNQTLIVNPPTGSRFYRLVK